MSRRRLAGERPLRRPAKIVCIGLNYSDHAAETGAKIPQEPILFMKAPNTWVGPFDDVEIPKDSQKTDWEVELGVVIGKEARYLSSKEQAADYVAGYCISNDVSERAFQIEHGGQWTKGKSCDTFSPLGPWLVTPDEVSDVGSLRMSLRVNGELRQNGSTSKMIFGVLHLVWYISQFMTLEPGDLISTGTPPGVPRRQRRRLRHRPRCCRRWRSPSRRRRVTGGCPPVLGSPPATS